ncbi:UPF0287-domain-containing protein [Tricholoma matsutake]|nr:UPF0287-domain-containing protein [Tricholoma matsutake 945]
MHPQLSDKRLVCQEFIQALQDCHSNSWARLTGGCNRHKNELNQCLRTERLSRSSQNRELAKDRTLRAEQARRSFDSE